MYNSYEKILAKKMITPEKAASLVKDGDLITYIDHGLAPITFDKALGERAESLRDVAVKTGNMVPEPAFIQKGVSRDHIAWLDGHFNGLTRKRGEQGLVNYVACDYQHQPVAFDRFMNFDICVLETAPMDKHGFFNFGMSNSHTEMVIKKSKLVIIEINENVPVCYGGYAEAVHVSDVDYVIQGENRQLLSIKGGGLNEAQNKIADMIVEQIHDGACLQFGIGGLPNAIGKKLAESDVKDLGIHTEMLGDAAMELYYSGKVTGKKKANNPGKIAYTFALGSSDLYEFVDRNPICASFPVDYINAVEVIAANDNAISINNAVEIDLFSQISAESKGIRQISGTGGQIDFMWGSFLSRGGKAFICLTSTVTGKDGQLKSRIVPTFDPGTIVTSPRSIVNYVVTEYGMVQLKGLSTWSRAERLIEIAHPDFRDELIKEAEKLHIWRYSNKKM